MEGIIKQLIEEYRKLEEVEAITIAGSRAANRSDEQSDIDIDLFITAPISVEKHRNIATKFSSNMEIDNRFFGTGDEFFLKDYPIEIDVCLFDWQDIVSGLKRVMEDYQASTGYTTCFVHNVVNAQIVFDRHGEFSKTQEKYKTSYPKTLKQNIIRMNYPILRQCFSSYEAQIKKAITRGDLNCVNHRVTAFLASYYDILFAVNEMFHPGEKRLLHILMHQCDKCPEHLQQNIEALIQSVGVDSNSVLACLTSLVDELDVLLKQENLLD